MAFGGQCAVGGQQVSYTSVVRRCSRCCAFGRFALRPCGHSGCIARSRRCSHGCKGAQQPECTEARPSLTCLPPLPSAQGRRRSQIGAYTRCFLRGVRHGCRSVAWSVFDRFAALALRGCWVLSENLASAKERGCGPTQQSGPSRARRQRGFQTEPSQFVRRERSPGMQRSTGRESDRFAAPNRSDSAPAGATPST